MGSVAGWKRELWAVDLVALLVMTAMVEEKMGLKPSHQLHGVVESVNKGKGPFVGLLMTFPTEEIALQLSGFFVPSSDYPLVELAGMLLFFSLVFAASRFDSILMVGV